MTIHEGIDMGVGILNGFLSTLTLVQSGAQGFLIVLYALWIYMSVQLTRRAYNERQRKLQQED